MGVDTLFVGSAVLRQKRMLKNDFKFSCLGCFVKVVRFENANLMIKIVINNLRTCTPTTQIKTAPSN